MGKARKRRGRPIASGSTQPALPVRNSPRRGRRLIGLGVVAVLTTLGIAGYRLTGGAGAGHGSAVIDLPPGAGSGLNIVLITLDTLRSDRVGCYGYAGVETPALDALAADGVRFADAVTVAPLTLPAHTSILTGSYPPVHGVRNNGTYRLLGEHETLAERLQAEGYATAAFIAAFVLDRRYGLDQGFDFYDDQITGSQRAHGTQPLNPQRPGNVVTDAAIRWLHEHRQTRPGAKFFVWLHLFDPHTPYSPPEPFRSQYAASPYDGEVAFTDQQVGRFVEWLRESQLLDRTLLVVAGDHGEMLGDHGESTHGLLIYGSAMKVPLILHCPGLIPAGRVVDDRVVSVVDIKPTILELLGLDAHGCDGVTLFRTAPEPDRAVYQESLAPQLNHGWSPLYGLRRHDDKYIEAPAPEYYDLRSDPGEQQNLWPRQLAASRELAAQLGQFRTDLSAAEKVEAAVTPDSDALRKLAALGYVGGQGAADSGPRPDPKVMIARFDRQLEQANALVSARRPQEAIPLLEALLATTPADASLWSLLSAAQVQASRLDEAIESRMRAIELQPQDANGWVLLASMQYDRGDAEASAASLAEAARIEPELGAIYLVRGTQAAREKRYDEAIALAREAARRDPTRYTAKSWALLGIIYTEMGRTEEAQAAFERGRQAGRR